jgi:hypothetical protein
MLNKKREKPIEEIEDSALTSKKRRCIRQQKVQDKKRKKKESSGIENKDAIAKRRCLNIDCRHSYLLFFTTLYGIFYTRIYQIFRRIIQ